MADTAIAPVIKSKEERAQFHLQEGKRKEALLESLLKQSTTESSSIDTSALLTFSNRYSNRLYLGPFLRGLLHFTSSQIDRPNVIFWSMEQDLLTQTEDEYLKDAVSLLLKSLCICWEVVPPFKSLDQLASNNNTVIYHFSFHPSVDDDQLNRLSKSLKKVVARLKSVTKASGTLILNDMTRLRTQ